MSDDRLLRLLAAQPRAGDFAYFFATYVRLAYEVSRVVEALDADRLDRVRTALRGFLTKCSVAAHQQMVTGRFNVECGRPGGRARMLWSALENSTRRFNCLVGFQRAIVDIVELAILTYRPAAPVGMRSASLAQLCYMPPMPLPYGTLQGHVPDWSELSQNALGVEADSERMWLFYAVESLVDGAIIAAAVASVTPEPERYQAIHAAEQVLSRAVETLCAPPDYSDPPRPLRTFSKTDQLRPMLKAILEGHTRLIGQFDFGPTIEWKPERGSKKSVVVVLPNNQLLWHEEVWSTIEEYGRNPIEMIRRREHMIPVSLTVLRLKAWQRELEEIRLGRKISSAATAGAISAGTSTVEAFAESQGIPTLAILSLTSLFEVIKILRER